MKLFHKKKRNGKKEKRMSKKKMQTKETWNEQNFIQLDSPNVAWVCCSMSLHVFVSATEYIWAHGVIGDQIEKTDRPKFNMRVANGAEYSKRKIKLECRRCFVMDSNGSHIALYRDSNREKKNTSYSLALLLCIWVCVWSALIKISGGILFPFWFYMAHSVRISHFT